MKSFPRAFFAAYVAGVLILMFAPVPGVASALPSQTDKLVHVGLFVGFGALLYWDRYATGAARPAGVLALSAATAALVEAIQVVIPYRSGSVWDFVMGALGATAGILAARYLLSTPRDTGNPRGRTTP